MTSAVSLARFLSEAKRAGGEHSPQEIAGLIHAYQAHDIDDDLMTDWLRAVCSAGMSLAETAALTQAMAHSGRILEWPLELGTIVDKHSTGGVGDAVTLIAVPLAAACGAKVAKLSGRALGHTGGTLDKLECIPGLRTDLSLDEFVRQVGRVGCAVAAASAELAPADKALYALRDRTATVQSPGLIAASVLSKKIAGGAAAIVLDVKTGSGAFMASQAEAEDLGRMMIQVGRLLGKRVDVLITDMNEPLADSVGDALELDEALSVLEGGGFSASLKDVAIEVSTALVDAANGSPPGFSKGAVDEALEHGAGRQKFLEMVGAQGGRLLELRRDFHATGQLAAARDGIVQAIDTRAIGELVAKAKGAVASSDAARTVGVRLRRRAGQRVRKGEALAIVFGVEFSPALGEELRRAVLIGDAPRTPRRFMMKRL